MKTATAKLATIDLDLADDGADSCDHEEQLSALEDRLEELTEAYRVVRREREALTEQVATLVPLAEETAQDCFTASRLISALESTLATAAARPVLTALEAVLGQIRDRAEANLIPPRDQDEELS